MAFLGTSNITFILAAASAIISLFLLLNSPVNRTFAFIQGIAGSLAAVIFAGIVSGGNIFFVSAAAILMSVAALLTLVVRPPYAASVMFSADILLASAIIGFAIWGWWGVGIFGVIAVVLIILFYTGQIGPLIHSVFAGLSFRNRGTWLFIILVAISAFLLLTRYTSYLVDIIIILVLIFLFFGQHRPVRILFVMFIIALIVFILVPIIFGHTPFMSEKLIESGIIPKKLLDQLMYGSKEATLNIKEKIKTYNASASWGDFWNKQVDYATGGYFTGKVEQGAKDERLGIFLDNIDSSIPIIYEGDESMFWVTLKGKTLDTPREVRINCNMSDVEYDPPLNSEGVYEISSYEEVFYSCSFKNMESGNAKVVFEADYDFQTLGYLKTYFMDQDTLRALRSKDIDPLDEFAITDKNPSAVFTQGPVMIGMDVGEYLPLSVKTDLQPITRLGVTLENRWDGYIKNVTNFEIQVPLSVELKNCDHDFIETDKRGCEERCGSNRECLQDCVGFRYYKLDQTRNKIQDVQKYHTFRCMMYTYSTTDLLGGGPIGIQYMRAIADYTYVANKTKIFVVRDIKDSPVYVPPPPVPDSSSPSGASIYQSPVSKTVVTSCFGWRDLNSNPADGEEDWHDGIDFGASRGDRVVSVWDGKVHSICPEANKLIPDDKKLCGGYGGTVIISHDGGIYTRYSHLSKITVSPGNLVQSGGKIGEVGNSGSSTGPHLDFKIYFSTNFAEQKDDYSRNPLCYFRFPYTYGPNAKSCKAEQEGDIRCG